MAIFRYIKTFLKKYGKYIFRGGGVLGLFVAAFFLISGIFFLCQNSTTKDSQDFFSTWNFEVQRDSYAIVLEPDGIEFDGQWDMGEIGLFKILADMNNSGKGLFIGVAPESDIRSYLNGVEYDKMTALWIFPPRADYQKFDGKQVPADPASQEFWIATSYGRGTNELIWDPEHDKASVLIMNTDGSAGLDLSVQVKTMVGILFIAGVINIMAGIFILLLSLMSILYARRTANTVYPRPLLIYPTEKENGEATA